MNVKKCILLSFLGLASGPLFAQMQESSADKAPLNWFNLDYQENGVRGVSTEKAYREILNKKKSHAVIVAIIDSGVDIAHEDLLGRIWKNEKEIPGNGIDDDKNGYVDDIYGWDFLGNKNGQDIDKETTEITREYARLKKVFENTQDPGSLAPKMKADYDLYLKYKAKYEEKVKELEEQGPFVLKLYEKYNESKQLLTTYFNKADFTREDLAKINDASSDDLKRAKRIFEVLEQMGQNEEKLKEAYDYFNSQYKFAINLDYNPRNIVGDDINNLKEKGYGNNEVKGPDARHGTHVAGIVAANRNNSLGVEGVCNDVKIMVLRAVPDGDERDKDVANAIRYAAENGASIINMSFGKAISPQKTAVDEAVKFAQAKGVLFIHAAGNENEDIDVNDNFPTRKYLDGKEAENWIEVGASSWVSPPGAVAEFSNYGHKSVDVFAPGVDLKSTVVGSKYEDLSGTSMAAPVVTGIAALLKSYYPELNAAQIKKIILSSALTLPGTKVTQPGSGELVDFGSLSSTGGIVNTYEAVKMAENMGAGHHSK